MPQSAKKSYFYQYVAFGLTLVLLTGCGGSTGGTDSAAMASVGAQLHQKGDDIGAAKIYDTILQRQPGDVPARLALADILEAHGDYAGAAQVYRTGLAVTPDNMELLHGLGRVLLKQGDAEDAKQAYRQILAHDSDNAKALNGLGIALDYQNNHVAAQDAYKEALAQNPDDLAIANNLARSYSLSGAYADTIKLLEPHVNDKHAPMALRQNLAEAYAMTGMDADAERVARMDLSGPALAHKLAAYRSMRSKVAPMPRFYADLGRFTTAALAEARLEAVREVIPVSDGLVLKVTADVSVIGGVPHFNVMASGFARAQHLRSFCASLNGAGVACKPHGL